MDCGIIAFGGDGTEAFRQIRSTLKTAPDTHKMGRIVIVGGATITHPFAAGAGNVDVISAARTGPGYHDEAYEHGADYPPVFVHWHTQRNLELVLRFMSEGKTKGTAANYRYCPNRSCRRRVRETHPNPKRGVGSCLHYAVICRRKNGLTVI